MPDEQRLLKERLGKLGLAPQREEEIVRELGEHLEDHTAALEARGMASEEAARLAVDDVPDWSKLRVEILSAETEETTMDMSYRTKALWLPALGALTLSSSLLALFQFSGLVPRFYWLSNGMCFTLYIPWLITLPVVGAVAALWSQRSGGKTSHRLLAALAPPLGMLGTFFIAPFLALLIYMLISMFGHGTGYARHPLTLNAPPLIGVLVVLTSWVLLPAFALLLGAAPFLRKPQPQA